MKIKLHLKIFVFIIIFILTRQIEIYGVIMLFATFHELGHMIAGIILGFKPNLIEIMPFGLSIGFDVKADNYNKKIGKANILSLKKIIIAASGPITNIIFIIIFTIFDISFFNINKILIIYANILIGLFNLIPIYPLDGGRIIKGIIHIKYGRVDAYKYTNIISNVSICILTLVSSIAILYVKNISILIILGYLWFLVINENKKYKKKKEIYKTIEKLNKKEISAVN